MGFDELQSGEKVSICGAALAVLGALLPWASVRTPTATGLDGNGLFTLAFALVAVGLLASGERDRVNRRAVLGLGVLIVVVAVATASVAGALTSPGTGVYVTVVGGAALAAGSGLDYVGVDAREGSVESAD